MSMKLILRGKTIEDEPTADAIFKILGDKHSRKILESLIESHKSALDVSKECNISLALTYKKIKNLTKYDLIQVSNSVIVDGRKYAVYKSKAHPIMAYIMTRDTTVYEVSAIPVEQTGPSRR